MKKSEKEYMISMLKHIKPLPFKVGDKVMIKLVYTGDSYEGEIKEIGKNYFIFKDSSNKKVI